MQHQGPNTVLAGFMSADDQADPYPDFEGEDWVDVNDVLKGQKQLFDPEIAEVYRLVKDHPGKACGIAHAGFSHKAWKLKSGQPIIMKNWALFIPVTLGLATKSMGGVEKGDLVVEGYVSAPIKDLQGDILDEKALIQAKNVMTKPPYNHVWLDHFSPYAKPMQAGDQAPIGNFVDARLKRIKGIPALWAKMILNKAHPQAASVAYQLRKGFYNAFSMEFVPQDQAVKMVGGRPTNVITGIKYFATCLVRAPAQEIATVEKVYTKAFANSSKFYPVRVLSSGGVGQTVRTKGVNENLSIEERLQQRELEPEEEPEPELEPEQEPEGEPEEDPGFPQQAPPGKGDQEGSPLEMRDYDRETGTTAPERANTALGEWGDPALDKGAYAKALKESQARIERLEDYARLNGKQVTNRLRTLDATQQATLGVLKALTVNLGAIGKGLGIQLKGIDEDTLETLGKYTGFSDIESEQKPPEVKPGKLKPARQRIITSFDDVNPDMTSVDDQAVGGEPSGSGYNESGVKTLGARDVATLVRKEFRHEMAHLGVVRKGFSGDEYAGPITAAMRTKRLMENDDGSIESQMDIAGV